MTRHTDPLYGLNLYLGIPWSESMMLLKSKRLLIRPFTRDDETAAIALFTDPDFMAGSLDGLLSPAGARAKLQSLIDLYQTHSFSKLALVERNNQRLIGYCGFGLEPIEGPPVPEFGYRLHPDAHGRGLATEAAQLIVADAFKRLDMPYIRAIVEAENSPSRRVLEKLGMIYQRQVNFHDREWLLYRLERPG